MPRKSTKKVVKKRLQKKSAKRSYKKSKDGKINKALKEKKKLRQQYEPEVDTLEQQLQELSSGIILPRQRRERMTLEMNEPSTPTMEEMLASFDEDEGPLLSVRPSSPLRRPRIFDSDEEMSDEEMPLQNTRSWSPIRRPRFYESEDEWIV